VLHVVQVVTATAYLALLISHSIMVTAAMRHASLVTVTSTTTA
jgi:hypothetical protein